MNKFEKWIINWIIDRHFNSFKHWQITSEINTVLRKKWLNRFSEDNLPTHLSNYNECLFKSAQDCDYLQHFGISKSSADEQQS